MSNKSNILVVDDDLESLRLTVNILMSSESEYNVMHTNSADTAYKIAADRLPDLIITDWNMPHKSGIELINDLKSDKKTKNIPVIIISGYMITPLDLKKALDAGAMDYLTKPVQSVELEARVNSALLLARSYQEIIRIKNNEINDNSLYLIRTNEFIKSIPKKLQALKEASKENQSVINAVEKEIEHFLKSGIWERFDTSFSNLHTDFHKNLLNNFPTLSPKELKLSAFILLGMSTKDMASLLNQEPDSIKVARYRLRQKLELDKGQNLQAFLASI